MARINLLPWREELRKEKQREFAVAAAGSAFVMAGIILLVHLNISGLISNQNSRNSFMQGQIEIVEAKIKEIRELEKQKQQLISRMKVIEQLQTNRPEIVHVFEEIVKTVPEGLSITSIKQSGSGLAIQGSAQSNARVSAFMRNLEASPWFNNPVLNVIKTDKKKAGRTRSFSMQVKQSTPDDNQENKG